MDTLIRPIDGDSLREARQILERGGVVAFPTETVYGLGADARSDEAVETIYRVKGRPSDNPLIVHVHAQYDLAKLVRDDRAYTEKLRRAFLPGPLTLVYKSKATVSAKVSCGLDTLAVRVPSHEGAQSFLRAVDMPIAAPSANRSKHISPVTARHVYQDLQGKIPLILDGGACLGGIESTVCDVTGEIPVVLRAGLISRDMIASVVGDCLSYIPKEGEAVRSPGMKYKHYAPSCRTRLFDAGQEPEVVREAQNAKRTGQRVCILCEHAVADWFVGEDVLDLGETAEQMAARLYELLHEAEERADLLLAVRPREREGVMEGVMNRLEKACAQERG